MSHDLKLEFITSDYCVINLASYELFQSDSPQFSNQKSDKCQASVMNWVNDFGVETILNVENIWETLNDLRV